MFSYEVRCENCNYFQLWGLEQLIRALVRAGKLRLTAEFDAALVSELFRIHIRSVHCPECGKHGCLTCRAAKAEDWNWADEVRCEECKAEIPKARVDAIPGVKRCVECQREQDVRR
ncbi:MAG: TraR/DksA C4-type zinc finger protein [Thermoguttaceae bacterium]